MIAYFRDVCVGAVRCQYEPPSNDPANIHDGRIYIMTLGVLAPYRRYGIGILFVLLISLNNLPLISLKSRYSHILKDFVFHGKILRLSWEILILGTKLLDHVLAQAEAQNKTSKDPVKSLYLHVQTTNQEALDWYTKRGFEIQETVEGYYRNIEDRDAYVLVRKL